MVRVSALMQPQTAKNLLALVGWQVAQYIIPLATLPYLARTLGPAVFGQISMAVGIVAYILVITEWGFALTATQMVAQHRHDRDKLFEIFYETIAAKLALSIPALVSGAAFVYFTPQMHALFPIFIVVSMQVISGAFTSNWLLQGVEDMLGFTWASFVGRAIVVPLTFLFVHSEHDAIIAVGLQTLGTGLTAAISLWFSSRYLKMRKFDVSTSRVWAHMTSGWDVFVSQIAATLYAQSNVIVVGLISGDLQAGFYGSGERIRRAAQGILTPVSMLLYPKISGLAATDRASALRLAGKGLLIQLATSSVISLLMLSGAPLMVSVLLGAGFQDAVPVVRVLAIVPMLVAISNAFGVQIMIPFGHKRAVAKIILTAGIANITIVIPLAAFLGALGGAIALVTAELVVSVAMALFIFRQFGWRPLAEGLRTEPPVVGGPK